MGHHRNQPPAGSNVNQAVLAALAVPQPDLVAGTPSAYAYDPSTHTFTLSYSTQRADGAGAFPAGSPTTVAVPAVQYPQGYGDRRAGGVHGRRAHPGRLPRRGHRVSHREPGLRGTRQLLTAGTVTALSC